MNCFCSDNPSFQDYGCEPHPNLWHVSVEVEITQEPNESDEMYRHSYVRSEPVIMKFIFNVRHGMNKAYSREVWFRRDGSDIVKQIMGCFDEARKGRYYNTCGQAYNSSGPSKSMTELPVFLHIANHPDWIQDQIKELITSNHILKLAE